MPLKVIEKTKKEKQQFAGLRNDLIFERTLQVFTILSTTEIPSQFTSLAVSDGAPSIDRTLTPFGDTDFFVRRQQPEVYRLLPIRLHCSAHKEN